MSETDVGRIRARPGRCVHHETVAPVAQCAVCGAALCVACAVPVRGVAVGPECLDRFVDIPGPVPPPPPAVPRLDPLAVVGFAVVLGLSILPWSRFGDASGYLQAWTVHWSLAAVALAAVGLIAAVVTWRRPGDLRIEAAVVLAVALGVAGAALLHTLRPPPLSRASAVPILAILAAAAAGASGVTKAVGAVRLRRGYVGGPGADGAGLPA